MKSSSESAGAAAIFFGTTFVYFRLPACRKLLIINKQDGTLAITTFTFFSWEKIRMEKFEIKIFRGSNIIKEISCNEYNKDIKGTVQSVKYLKKANKEFLKDLVEKQRLANSTTTSSTTTTTPCEDDEEDLMGADDDDEEDNNHPELKKTKLS